MAFLLSYLILVSTNMAFAMNGELVVQTGSLRLQREDGMKTSFYPGNYHAQIFFYGDRANIMIDRRGARTDAILNYPAGTVIPENGTIDIDGFATGQTFAITGTASTVVGRSENTRGTEECFYDRQEWVCGGFGSNYECNWVSRPVKGQREVEYYFESRIFEVSLNLDSHTGGVATFSGKDMNRRKLYTFQANCF